MERIQEQCQTLSEFPDRGVRREELGPGIRLLSLENRISVYYRVLKDRVQIVRIIYAGRDAARLFRHGPER